MIIFNWEIGCTDYVFGRSEIVSPSFYIEPSRTFEFYLRLYPFGLSPLYDYMTLELCRCDSSERSIELRYKLRIDSTTNETSTYNFKPPRQFPKSKAYLSKPSPEYGPVLRITCRIFNGIFQDLDENVMTDLSADYESLLDDSKFSDSQYKDEEGYFYVHNAIIEARCDKLFRKLNTLERVDSAILRSIMKFLYSGKILIWPTSDISEMMQFGNWFLKNMNLFIISEYSAKTLFVGECYIFDWVIENCIDVRYETVYTYVITEGDAVMQVSFFPYREDVGSNFSIKILKSRDCFIRAKVAIEKNEVFFNLVDMSNSEDDISSLEVNKSVPINWVRDNIQRCVTNGAVKLKIQIHMCSFNANYTSNVDTISYTNISMQNLVEDYKKLFHHPSHYNYEIIVNNQPRFRDDYKRYFESYAGFNADEAMFEEDYARIKKDFMNTDATFWKFSVHKAILSARSSFFQAQFRHDCIETQKNQTETKDINPYVVYKMLLFMYCGELSNLNVEIAMDLNSAADMYGIKMLVNKCSKFLESNIKKDNVHKIRTHAGLRMLDHLCTACNQFLEKIGM